MNDKKPIKRNQAIVEFSKDHHFALLFVWKIREGVRKSIDPSRMIPYALHFFDFELISHFKEEEELLFNKLPINNNLRIRAEEDHKNIRQLIDSLRKNLKDSELLEELVTTLEKHIRFEERELFNHLQEALPNEVLKDVASSLKSRNHPPKNEWHDAFWLDKDAKV